MQILRGVHEGKITTKPNYLLRGELVCVYVCVIKIINLNIMRSPRKHNLCVSNYPLSSVKVLQGEI